MNPLTVKTLKEGKFEIRVNPSDTILAIKKNIEESQGKDKYPFEQQELIHNGTVLKDEMTWENSKVNDRGILLRLNKMQGIEPSQGDSDEAETESQSSDETDTYEQFCIGLQFLVTTESNHGREIGYTLVERSAPLELVNPFNLFSTAFNNANATADEAETPVEFEWVHRLAEDAGYQLGLFCEFCDNPPRQGLAPSPDMFSQLGTSWTTFGFVTGRFVKEKFNLDKQLVMQEPFDFFTMSEW